MPGATIDLWPIVHAGLGVPDGRTLLFFERGHWCAECVRHLEEIRSSFDALSGFAPGLAAITHEPAAAFLARTYPFPVLADPDLRLAGPLDLVHNDESGKQTIRPSTLLLDERGAVLFSYVGDDSRDRPSIAALLLGFQSFEL